MAAAPSSAAVVAVAASSPLGAALSVPALGLGTTAILSTGTSSTTFWDRFSTWPIFPLSGITEVWPFILTIFLIYVGIILLTDGDMLINAIQGSLNFGQGKTFVHILHTSYDLKLLFHLNHNVTLALQLF